MSYLEGQTLTYVSKGEKIKVSWKQGSLLGYGGDKSQYYYLCTYSYEGHEVPVYVQADYTIKSNLTVDSSLQYGMQEGVVFYVYHNKSQTPYQHRFRTTTLQKFAYAMNALVNIAAKIRTRGKANVDLSWIAGDYLRDI